jgi:predicted nuclease with TOPRIM domain
MLMKYKLLGLVFITGICTVFGLVYLNSRTESTFNELQEKYDVLTIQNDKLFSNYTALKNEYSSNLETINKLGKENMATLDALKQIQQDYESVSNSLNLINKDYEPLKTRNSELSSQINTLNYTLVALNSTYIDLKILYDDLLEEVNLINGPTSKMTTINDLIIEVKTNKQIYSYREGISGNVTIRNKDGSPFKGGVAMKIGTTSGYGTYGVNGVYSFSYAAPIFLTGPGTYQVGPCYITDEEGYFVVLGGELESTWITITAK